MVDAIADSGAPLETVVFEGQFPDAEATAELAAMSRLHTFRPGLEAMPLPGGDPDVVWIGDASSIRALGRAATSSDPITRTQALERIAGLGRNRARYESAGLADEIGSERRARMDRHDPLLGYLQRATSLEWQHAQFENRDRNPYVALEPKHWLVGVFHTIVPSGYWHPTTAFERLLRDHSRRVVRLPIVRSSDDLSSQPEWIEFRAHAELIRSHMPR